MYGSCVAAMAARDGCLPPAGDVSDAARWPRPTAAAIAAAAAASWTARSWMPLDRTGGRNSVRPGSSSGAARSAWARSTTPAVQASQAGQTATCARSESRSTSEISPSTASDAHIRARSQYRVGPIIDESDVRAAGELARVDLSALSAFQMIPAANSYTPRASHQA